MITPTTRDEWQAAFCDWCKAVDLSPKEIAAILGLEYADPVRIWRNTGRVPKHTHICQRIREVTGIDVEPLRVSIVDQAQVRGNATKKGNYVTHPERCHLRAGVPIPLPPTQAQIDAGYAALRRTGGYAPHDLTKRLPSKGPRFVPAPRQGSPWTQSALAEV